MKVMLETIREQRDLHIERLEQAKDPRVIGKSRSEVASTLTFSKEDMQTFMNEWKLDVEKWMNPATMEAHWNSKHWHGICKSAFSTYLQHLSGCKFLLRSLIALPIISYPEEFEFAQPGSSEKLELLRQLARDWREYRRTDEHQAAVKRSQPSDQARLSQRLHQAQTRYKEGAKLSRQVAEGTVDYKDLDTEKQTH